MSVPTLTNYGSDVRVLRVKNLLEPERPEPKSTPCTGGTLRSYLPADWANHPHTIVELNGQRVGPDRWDHRYVGPGDMVYMTQIPGVVGTWFATKVLLLAKGSFLAGLVATTVNLAIGFGLSYIAGIFDPMPDPEGGAWEGRDRAFQTLAKAGIPVPLYYGEFIVPGNIISVRSGHGPNATPYNKKGFFWSETGDFVTNILVALGEGVYEEICGYTVDVNEHYFPTGAPSGASLYQGGDTLKINGNPAEDFISGGFISTRRGGNYQQLMPRMPCESKTTGIDIEMRQNVTVQLETSEPVDAGVGLVFYFPDGIRKLGAVRGTTRSSFVIRVLGKVAGQPWMLIGDFKFIYMINGPTGITIHINHDPGRGSPNLAGNKLYLDVTFAPSVYGAPGLAGRIILKSMEEYTTSSSYIYPGTAMLQLYSPTVDSKTSISRITARCKTRKVWLDDPDNPDEEPQFLYSANPAACIKDLCLSIDGAGDEFTRESINNDTFSDSQEYNDETISDGQGGTMKRFEIGIEVKSPKSLMDWLVIMAGTCRAVPVWIGSQLELVVDKEEDYTQTFSLFGMGNIKAETFERIRLDNSDINSRYNAVDVEFRDSADDFNWNVAPAEDRDAIIASGRVRRRRQRVLGVTNYARAKILAHYLLNIIRYIDEKIKFEAFADACAIKPGRVIAVHHSILDWDGISGRIHIDSIGAVGVYFDQPFTVEDDTTYKVAVHTHGTGTEVIQVRQLVTAPGVYAAKTLMNVSPSWDTGDWPKAGNKYICGPDHDQGLGPASLYRVTSVERASDLTARIEALKYDKRVYANELGTINPPSREPRITSDTIPPNVESLTAIVDSEVGFAVLLTWENANWPYQYKCQIFGREDAISSVFHHIGITEEGGNFFSYPRVTEGHTYTFAVSPIAPGGAYRAAQMCPQFRIKVGRAAGPPPPLIP